MNKLILTAVLGVCMMNSNVANAEVKVTEPEFINSYCILTSDSTYDVLPKESGTIAKHQSKSKGLFKKIGGLSALAGAAGAIGTFTSGSVTGIVNGVRVMGTASAIGDAASTASSLACAQGMDIVFSGSSSAYSYAADGKDINLIIKAANNDEDPAGIYRIVKFVTSKKDRRVQWMEIEPAAFESADAKKGGYIPFTGHKYGQQSYLLSVPAQSIEKGEYGVFFLSISSATAIPVGTFSVK